MYIPLNCPSSNGNWMSKQKPLSGTHLVSSNWHPKSSKSDHLDTIWTPFGHHLDLLSIENPRFWGYPLVNCPITMETHHFQWENPLFLWSFSIAMLNYQRVYMPLNAIKTLGKHHKTMVLGVTPQWYPHGLSTSTVAARPWYPAPGAPRAPPRCGAPRSSGPVFRLVLQGEADLKDVNCTMSLL